MPLHEKGVIMKRIVYFLILSALCMIALIGCGPQAVTPATTTPAPRATNTEKPPRPTATIPSPTNTITPTATPAFKTLNLDVPGNQCWVDSGLELAAGELVGISASGSINTWDGRSGSNSDPDGQYKKTCGDVKCPLRGADYGALIGRIGEGESFLVGTKTEFNVTETGTLFLTVNDWGCDDNSGVYTVLIYHGEELPVSTKEEHTGSWNLAMNQTVSASNASAENHPKYAVDGDMNTTWGAGNFPPQWIEIDLGAPARVEKIDLLVTQHPIGDTVHRILVRSADGEFSEVHRFEQSTSTGDWLHFVPDEPLENVQYVRIETVKSPSWVGWIEIEVVGEN